MSLGTQTALGVVWSALEQFARRGVTAVVTLALAAFLTPEDYGLLAMTAVFLAIAGAFMESGFKDALIRQAEVTDTDLSTAFWATFGFGWIACGALQLLAPAIAGFYDEPRLTSVIRVVSLSIPLHAMEVVQVVRLTRDLNFRRQMLVTFPAAALSGAVAVGAAAFGAGVWALVAQRLAQSVFASLFFTASERWIPQFHFDRVAFRDMYAFGSRLALANVMTALFDNAHTALLAGILKPALLGQFFFAEKIRDLAIGQFVGAVQRATFPALARVHQSGGELKTAYRWIVKTMMASVAPALMAAALASELLFGALFGDRWTEAGAAFKFLALGSVSYPLNAVNVNLLRVLGRSDILLFLTPIKRTVTVGMMVGLAPYGVKWIAIGYGIAGILNYIPNVLVASSLSSYSIREQLQDVSPYVFCSCFAFGCGTMILHQEMGPLWVRVVSAAVVFGLAYLAPLVCFNDQAIAGTFAAVSRRILRESRRKNDS